MIRGYCGACGDPFDGVTPCSCGPAAAPATKADTDKPRHLSDITDGGYDSLRSVLLAAFDQASQGKGRERHAEDKPFDKQDICQEARDLGLAFPLGQARKKLKESLKLLDIRGPNAAIAEILGAINYAAAAVIVLQEEMERLHDKPVPVSD